MRQKFYHKIYKSSKKITYPEIINLIPQDLAERYQAIPIKKEGNMLPVAMANPLIAIQSEIHSALVSRIRIMADLDIAERRLP